MISDSHRQATVNPSTDMPTTFVVLTTNIKTTLYHSIPKAITRHMDLKPRDILRITVNADQSYTVTKQANGPHHT